MIDKICDNSRCTGCSACMNICPTSSIRMQPGELGHIFPVIADTCIDCMRCVKTCPVNNPVKLQWPLNTLAFWAKDEYEHHTSTSGGAAACFSNCILEHDGVVYGCASLPGGIIEHIRVDKKEEAYKLKGSKYVQSNINDIFKLVKNDLANGRKVIFVGLPCQVAGLKNFIGNKNDNLFMVDLICHGVPSQKVFFEYVETLGIKREDVEEVTFREAKGCFLSISSRGGRLYRKNECQDLYYMAFNDNLCFRESCFTCPYSSPERIGDITLGDFWGLGKKIAFPFNAHGNVSVVLVNNEKGQVLLDLCKDKYECVERTLDEAVEGNHNLKCPSTSDNNKKFKSLYGNVPLKKALKVCCRARRLKAPFVPIVRYIFEKIL